MSTAERRYRTWLRAQSAWLSEISARLFLVFASPERRLLFAASIVVALETARTGLPVLVAFLAVGMLLGSEGPGGIEFDDARLAREVGTVGLALILYEGGLQTSWRRLRQVVVRAALLSTVGVAVSAVLTGVAAYSEPGSSISVSQE